MEPKKNPKADISRNGSIYFAIGLALMVFFSYMVVNWKVYEKSDIEGDTMSMNEEDMEEMIIINPPKPPPPPPPPPAAPEVIEIVEDEVEIEETVIESTETDQEEEIEIEDIEIEEVEEVEEVPFSLVEDVPVFPGCENKKNNEARKKCMSEKITKIVVRRFNTDLAGDLGLSGRQRISVIFKVDKTGNITDVMARAPHPRLAKEAKRVVGLIPKMKPGKQRGNPVVVQYSLPIIFTVQD
jgi:protein TonB